MRFEYESPAEILESQDGMTQVLIYITGAHEYAIRTGFRKSCVNYAFQQGLGELKSDQYSEEAVPGAILQEIMQRALPGSHFITNSLAAFGTKPSEQRQRIRELQGRDVTVHVLGLGPIDNVMNVLKAAWDAAGPLEEQLLQMEQDYAAHEEQLTERMARFEDKLVARLSELKGHGAVKEFYGLNGHVSTPAETEVTDPTAIRVRELRGRHGPGVEVASAADRDNRPGHGVGEGPQCARTRRMEAGGRDQVGGIMRRAVEQLGPAPKVEDQNDDRHPYNRGLIFADIGNLVVYMFTDDPGRFYLDIHGQQPASDAQAKAAFGVADFNRYRAQAVELDDDRQIEAALAAPQQPEPQPEDLKAKVRRLVREQAKRTQAEADRQRTSWLDNPTP